VTLQDGRTLEVSGLFVAIGRVPQSQLLAPLLELDAAGYVPADETGITDRKGLFVAGDVRTKALRQVVTAVSDGANAATSAAAYLRGL
jgi:thioredoxin reductase (NADPH)